MTTDPTTAARTPLPVVRLDASRGAADTVTATVQLAFGRRPVQLELVVPAGPVRPIDLLPIYQGLTNLVVETAVENVGRHGEAVSCGKGCGACCRQPVPVSHAEAHAIARLVDGLPEPRRSAVRARFADARRRLADAGLLDAFLHPDRVTGVEAMANGAAYFDLGIACPFLEDESCSIHPDRPLACREYLVTSPAENCARPAVADLRPVPLPARVAAAVRAADAPAGGAGWVLLALAPDWAADHPEPPPRPAAELLRGVFDRLLPRTDWVRADNLRPFLTAVGWAVGAEFGPGDWAAVERGVADTDEAADRWSEFTYAAARPARVRLARTDPAGTVRVRADVPDDVVPQVRLAVGLCQQYRVRPATE